MGGNMGGFQHAVPLLKTKRSQHNAEILKAVRTSWGIGMYQHNLVNTASVNVKRTNFGKENNKETGNISLIRAEDVCSLKVFWVLSIYALVCSSFQWLLTFLRQVSQRGAMCETASIRQQLNDTFIALSRKDCCVLIILTTLESGICRQWVPFSRFNSPSNMMGDYFFICLHTPEVGRCTLNLFFEMRRHWAL